MSIPLSVFLIIYLILGGIILLFFLISFLYLLRLSALDSSSVLISFVFLCGIIILIYLSSQYLFKVDWQEPIGVLSGIKIEIPKFQLPGQGQF